MSHNPFASHLESPESRNQHTLSNAKIVVVDDEMVHIIIPEAQRQHPTTTTKTNTKPPKSEPNPDKKDNKNKTMW